MVWDPGYAGDVLLDSENEMGHATARTFGNDIAKETHHHDQPRCLGRRKMHGEQRGRHCYMCLAMKRLIRCAICCANSTPVNSRSDRKRKEVREVKNGLKHALKLTRRGLWPPIWVAAGPHRHRPRPPPPCKLDGLSLRFCLCHPAYPIIVTRQRDLANSYRERSPTPLGRGVPKERSVRLSPRSARAPH
jgi:hypothetical protein